MNSLEPERAVIGCVLQSGQMCDLSERDFCDPLHREIGAYLKLLMPEMIP